MTPTECKDGMVVFSVSRDGNNGSGSQDSTPYMINRNQTKAEIRYEHYIGSNCDAQTKSQLRLMRIQTESVLIERCRVYRKLSLDPKLFPELEASCKTIKRKANK